MYRDQSAAFDSPSYETAKDELDRDTSSIA
jgi:hypothetical protein